MFRANHLKANVILFKVQNVEKKKSNPLSAGALTSKHSLDVPPADKGLDIFFHIF